MSKEVRDEAPTGEAPREDPTDEDPTDANPTDEGRPGRVPASPAGGPTRVEAFVSGGAYGVLAVGGAVIGLLGSFYHATPTGLIPVFAIAFALLNLVAFRLAGWAMGTRLGAVVPALAWLLVVIFLSSKRPEGDLVISASTAGYVFLLGGSLGAVLAVARTRSAGGAGLLPIPR